MHQSNDGNNSRYKLLCACEPGMFCSIMRETEIHTLCTNSHGSYSLQSLMVYGFNNDMQANILY